MTEEASLRFERYQLTDDIDHRLEPKRDRDRLMFSYAVQRLGGVCQVASVVDGHVFHNRLTHTLEMAQLGRRLAERLLDLAPASLDLKVHLDPDIVEASCLAHDTGHPPFGHEGESALNACMEVGPQVDGFEGNAQAFRIVNAIEPYRPNLIGLNLTRATLKALTKYPRYSATGEKKYSWYSTEAPVVEWMYGGDFQMRTIEADIMDLADDIAYAAHDLMDFTRAKVIPLYSLLNSRDSMDYVYAQFLKARTRHAKRLDPISLGELMRSVIELNHEYDGSRMQKAQLRQSSSNIIKYFRDEMGVASDDKGFPQIVFSDDARSQLAFFKFLTEFFAQEYDQILSQRMGYNKIVRTIHFAVSESLANGRPAPVPRGEIDTFSKLSEVMGVDQASKRSASDFVCSLTDLQAVSIYQRIEGISSATFLRYSDG